MNTAKILFKKYSKLFLNDSLYRNSIVLLLSNLVIAIFGFVFWIICARMFKVSQVGLATALISACGLVAGIGILGSNNSIIRYLPHCDDKNRLINTLYLSVGVVSLIAAVVFVLTLNLINGPLEIINSKLIYIILFILFVVSTALNIVIDNTFTAFRSTHFTLYKNALFSMLKLILLFPLFKLAGFGIFTSYGLAVLLVVLSGGLILNRKFAYKPKLEYSTKLIKKMARFSLANYVVSYINGAPALVLPLIITSTLGANSNAVYFISYSVASILFFIPLGIGNSLFAEGSHNIDDIKIKIKRAIKLTLILMVPSIILIFILAPVFMYFFGKDYSKEGVEILRILSLSSIFIAISYPCGSILNIMHKLRSLIIVNFIGALSVIGSVYLMIHRGNGIIGVAWGWLLGWAVYAIVYVFAAHSALSKTS